MKINYLLSAVLLFSVSLNMSAQNITEKYKRFLTQPNGYVAYRTAETIKIDGILDEKAWKDAPHTESFVDISGDGFPPPRFNTRAKMLWDDENLYISAELEEPSVWADLSLRDTIVYYNNDFEVFIDPDGDGHNYFEIETNAIGTIFDLFVQRPYRAKQRAFVTFEWNAPGMQLATHINGTLNNSKDKDKGWTVEIAIPHKAIAAEFDNYYKAGNYLRVGFSRVEWQTVSDKRGHESRKKDKNGKFLPEDNWTWGSTGQVAMHMPERWGFVYLSDKNVGQETETFKYPDDYPIEKLLWAMYYAQEEQFNKTGSYFIRIDQFKLVDSEINALPRGSVLKVEAISNKYEINAILPDGRTVSIDEDGYIWKKNGNN